MPPISRTAAVLAAVLLPAAAIAQPVGFPSMTPKGSIVGPEKFPEQGGPALYKAVCQGCHQPDAMGAAGAGKYPALAKNPKLGAAGYPVIMVLNGHGAMPSFRTMLDDRQIADVVTYVRTNFGNSYAAPVTPAQVKAARGG
jgi:mono/diheme cytochrome c family protein